MCPAWNNEIDLFLFLFFRDLLHLKRPQRSIPPDSIPWDNHPVSSFLCFYMVNMFNIYFFPIYGLQFGLRRLVINSRFIKRRSLWVPFGGIKLYHRPHVQPKQHLLPSTVINVGFKLLYLLVVLFWKMWLSKLQYLWLKLKWISRHMPEPNCVIQIWVERVAWLIAEWRIYSPVEPDHL